MIDTFVRYRSAYRGDRLQCEFLQESLKYHARFIKLPGVSANVLVL